MNNNIKIYSVDGIMLGVFDYEYEAPISETEVVIEKERHLVSFDIQSFPTEEVLVDLYISPSVAMN